jgi:hypothetical protein
MTTLIYMATFSRPRDGFFRKINGFKISIEGSSD